MIFDETREDVYVLELPEGIRMNGQNLKTPQVKGIILGLIVAIMLTAFRIPPPFALVVGIIFGFVAFVVLDENKNQK
jgi:chromate transport protein ChrA